MCSKVGLPIKIMIDTNIYDELYKNVIVRQKFIQLIELNSVKFYTTPIQEEEIKKNLKPEDKDKVKWSLNFNKQAEEVPSLFSFDVEGAGYDQSRFATSGEISQYETIKPNSSQHHKDKNLAVVADGQVDIFVTNNTKDFSANNLHNVKIMNWNEFIKKLEDLLQVCQSIDLSLDKDRGKT
jgi:predicted nucleic acid-binding protein